MNIECYQCGSTYETETSTAEETEVFCCQECEKQFGPVEEMEIPSFATKKDKEDEAASE